MEDTQNLDFLSLRMRAPSLNRRTFLKHSVFLGISATGALGLLAGCTGDAEDEDVDEPEAEPEDEESIDDTLGDDIDDSMEPEEDGYGGTLRFGALRDPDAFDPNQAGGWSHDFILGNVYDRLIDWTPEGDFKGTLAESWEIVDPTTYVFNLREGISYHNGQQFTAQDVVATLERIRDPDTVAADIVTVENIEEIATPDDYTVELRLRVPDQSLLAIVGANAMFIVSHEDADGVIESPDEYNGTGPFLVDRWETGREYVLTRNPEYWKPDRPFLDEVVILPMTDDGARVDGLLSGELDLAQLIPFEAFGQLEEQGFDIVLGYGLQSFIRFHPNQAPLDDVRVRQALAYVLDNNSINQLAFGGFGVPMEGPLQPPGSPYYQEELEGTYPQDWDRALELLQEAGYEGPEAVLPLDFQVSTSALAQQPALVIQEQWESFGFQVDFTSVDTGQLSANRAEGTYVIHMDGGGMAWPDPDYLRFRFHSELGTQYATAVGYANEDLDSLLEEGFSEMDQDRRREIYLEAEQIILDELPQYFVLWRPTAEAIAPHVEGFVEFPGGLEGSKLARFEELRVTS